jgi:hypothetical protein
LVGSISVLVDHRTRVVFLPHVTQVVIVAYTTLTVIPRCLDIAVPRDGP